MRLVFSGLTDSFFNYITCFLVLANPKILVAFQLAHVLWRQLCRVLHKVVFMRLFQLQPAGVRHGMFIVPKAGLLDFSVHPRKGFYLVV
jgi:hypothetical protein